MSLVLGESRATLSILGQSRESESQVEADEIAKGMHMFTFQQWHHIQRFIKDTRNRKQWTEFDK